MINPLILWGGTDIGTIWYGQPALSTTQTPNIERDTLEFNLVEKAKREDVPVIGVCRGGQLLCVANGGTLIQHVPKHQNNSHPILTYDDKIFKHVAADHHQVMVPTGEFIIYATSYDDYIPEIVYWPKTKCLAVQPHPEWMNKDHPFNLWLNDLIFNLFNLKGVF